MFSIDNAVQVGKMRHAELLAEAAHARIVQQVLAQRPQRPSFWMRVRSNIKKLVELNAAVSTPISPAMLYARYLGFSSLLGWR